jgi:hypothetical protein
MISKDIERLKGAITLMEGNLTQAARVLGISKQHVMALTRRYQLNEWARKLRVSNGHPPHGNPLCGKGSRTEEKSL